VSVLTAARARMTVAGVLALSLVVFALHVAIVRPYAWPGGAGIIVSGDTVFASMAEPRAVPRIRPPHLDPAALSQSFVVSRVAKDSAAGRSGVVAGMAVGRAASVEDALRAWRDLYRRGPIAPADLTASDTGLVYRWTPVPAWRLATETRREWLRVHLGTILQMAAFLGGAAALVALGTQGTTALLMTLALIFTAVANSGPMLGAEWAFPFASGVLLIFGWLATPLSFPIIGLAVLHFPSRAPILDRFPWIAALLPLLPLPVFIVSATAAAFLLGNDGALPPLAWFSANGWLFDTSFAVALAANVLIVIEGIHRYRTGLEASERRRIQIVVYTGVAAVFAYATKAGVPLVAELAGRPFEWPWLIEGVLQAIVLLPAFALPYAVAVKHVFSPRTVLRRSLQYALARRTLSVLIVLPIVALIVSLISERDRPLADIILGQPIFYGLSFGFFALALKYRDQAQRELDKRFFRAEYDAREILIALANRVPYEHDPAQLVSNVMTQIDSALHPESIAVLAGEETRLEPVASLRTQIDALARDSGVVTLLRWSEQPLEIFLDDDRSPAARLPAADRQWLATSGVSLLVPLVAGASGDDERALIGLIALGQKRSEEPYTPEDRKLLSGIATQMSVALDLSRLRKRASSGRGAASEGVTPTLTPTMIAGTTISGPPALAMCPACHRCYDLTDSRTADGTAVCRDDGTVLQPVIGMLPVVDGKYRVDAVVGRGGMGAVFRARDIRLERDVAIKVVRADLMADPASRARFQREAQIVARLQHPAIVTVFDYGNLPGGAAFLVMEFVRGEDLRHLLTREKTLPPATAVRLIAEVAQGVAAAHSAGVLHRDLKPENILLPASGTGPKILDFGVAKMTDTVQAGAQLTHNATIVGTPAYMAPEQLRGGTVDARADVYSLAVMLYEALTGRLPFGSGSFIDLALKQAEGPAIVDDVPLALAATLRRALSLDRGERPTTAAQFADALRLLL
jgi:predicted Ser/Thr protein kinase